MKKLDWKYCECGCHGHEVSVGSVDLWLYNDLKGKFYLHRGHGHSSEAISVLPTWEAANDAAVEFLKQQMKSVKLDLKRMKAVVGED